MKHTFIAFPFVSTGDQETIPQVPVRATAVGAVSRTSDEGQEHQLLLDPKYSTLYCQ